MGVVVIINMVIESKLFFQAIIKPVLIRFASDPYSLKSSELDLLNWYSKKFDQRVNLELSRLSEFIFSSSVEKNLFKMDYLDEK
jgi:hypothetical protein